MNKGHKDAFDLHQSKAQANDIASNHKLK